MSFMDDIRDYHAALEAAGHKLIRDAGGHIDTFRLDFEHHNGPECERCGESWCQHCKPTIEPCVPKVTKLLSPNDQITFSCAEADQLTIKPPTCFIFADEGKEIGRLSWADGTLSFTGNADESAKMFFEALKRMTQ